MGESKKILHNSNQALTLPSIPIHFHYSKAIFPIHSFDSHSPLSLSQKTCFHGNPIHLTKRVINRAKSPNGKALKLGFLG